MAILLNLSFEVHNLQDLHAKEAPVLDSLYKAAHQFITDEGWDPKSDFIVDFVGQKGDLAAYTPGEVAVKTYDENWTAEVTGRWKSMVKEIMGDEYPAELVIE